MAGFIGGVVSSLVASILLLFVGWFGSNRLRTVLTRILTRMTGADIERVFASQRDASAAVSAALDNAREVYVFAGRGNELTRPAFEVIWNGQGSKLRKVQIILPNPAKDGPNSWLSDREQETASHDKGYGTGLISQQIKSNLVYIGRKAEGVPAIEIRLCDFPNLCRIVMTDRVAFLTVYNDINHGSASRCLMLRNGGPMFDFCKRIFDKAWLTSVEYTGLGEK